MLVFLVEKVIIHKTVQKMKQEVIKLSPYNNIWDDKLGKLITALY